MTEHVSVFKKQAVDGLNIRDNAIIFDGTLGAAGHALEILQRAKNIKLVACDLDTDAIEIAKKTLKGYEKQVTIVNDNFKNFDRILDSLNIDKTDGFLLDLGISSMQIDPEKNRGFSYMAQDDIIDMRMDKRQELSAKTILNTYSEQELRRIIKEYGDEDYAAKIAWNIVRAREKKEIRTVRELVEIIDKCVPQRFASGHRAKKTFAALRKATNSELIDLDTAVIGMVRRLNARGRISVITFDSGEDRLIKQAYRALEADCICDKKLPVCICGKKKEINILTPKPMLPSEEEIKNNPRSASAKLRVAEKI